MFSECSRLLPYRGDFLDGDIQPAIKKFVDAGSPLIFMPNAISERNEYVNSEGIRGPVARIYVYGTLPCGSKTCVILEDIPVYALVAVPDDMKRRELVDLIAGRLQKDNIDTLMRTDEKLFKIRGFQREKSDWLKYTFATLQDRKKFLSSITELNKFRKVPIVTANDDVGMKDYYFQVVARQHKFNTADWNRITKYRKSEVNEPHCEYTLRVKLSDYVKLPAEKRKELIERKDAISDIIVRDHTLHGMWDIETWQSVQTGQPADPDDIDSYQIFMMCSGWAWHWERSQFATFCCVDAPTPARADVGVVIQCDTERDVIRAHTMVINRMSPDIIGAFNGGCFDWPCYRAKARHYGLLLEIRDAMSCARPFASETPDSVNKWCFRSESVKIDAENDHELKCVASFPGVIDVDILPIFLRLYSRAEVPKLASMNFFLAKNKLPSKADMPYKRMFRIYERAKKFQRLTAMKVGCHCATGAVVIDDSIDADIDDDTKCRRRYCDCENHVLQLDYKPKPGFEGEFPEDENYSDDLVDGIVCDGVVRCCHCAKRPQNLIDMGDIAYYCVIDCLRPQQLNSKRAILPDKRELSTMSCVCLYDAYYRADGMKVRNVIGKYAHKFGIAFSNARANKSLSEKDHYPGAWVCEPERKLNFDDPVSGMDYSSLYPSLMMTYNLSIDMVVYTEVEAKKLADSGYVLHQVGPFNYERGEKRGAAANKQLSATGWMVRHNGIMKPTDTETVKTYKRVTTWTRDGETLETYTSDDVSDDEHSERIERYSGAKVAHQYVPVKGRKALPGERMGLFPYILKKLFDKRKPIKAKFLYWSNIIDLMEKAGAHEWIVDGTMISADDLDFYKNVVDSKQKAIKVLANTFYGESGNFRSPIFELLVAAGTTTAGVANITRVRHMVTDRGCHVHYGDTDSLYLSPPRRIFMQYTDEYECEMAKIHARHRGVAFETEPAPDTPEAAYKRDRIAARLVLMEKKVKLTMKYMNDLKEHISLFLMRDNGTCFLNMAYEEVGMPTWFLGKKKYIMAAHMDVINFYPRNYFMRGIDIIKQGQTAIAVEIGERFITDNMRPENEDTVMSRMERELHRFCTEKIPDEKFAQKAKYKPEKKNVPVHVFIARMRIMNERYRTDETLAKVYSLPDPGDKFTYVIVKKETPFSVRGKKIELKKGDRMEFLRALIHSRGTPRSLVIDTHWYMENSISGILARFLSGEEQFIPPAGKHDLNTKEGYRKMDEECVKLASKWIMSRINDISGYNPDRDKDYGKEYRRKYTSAKKEIVSAAAHRHGDAGGLYYTIIDATASESPTMPPSNVLYARICAFAEETEPPGIGATIVERLMESGYTPFEIWNSMVSPRNKYALYTISRKLATETERNLKNELHTVAARFSHGADAAITCIQTIIDSTNTVGANSIDDDDIEEIDRFYDEKTANDLFRIVCGLRTARHTLMLCDEVERAVQVAKSKAVNEHAVPTIVHKYDRAVAAREDAKKSSQRAAPRYEFD